MNPAIGKRSRSSSNPLKEWSMRLRASIAAVLLLPTIAVVAQPIEESSYLLLFAGDKDLQQSDFLAVVDLRGDSPQLGSIVATTPIGMTASMPHHMEYTLPPRGESLFMNAHHHELSLLVDVSNPLEPIVTKTFAPPAPLRFPHDYTRTHTGTRLVGFLRSEGSSDDPQETAVPGNHGGIAEYSADGVLLRARSAQADRPTKPIRPYAFAHRPDIDRLVVTSAPMMEREAADVLQIYRYSTFELLHTLDLPVGRLPDGREVTGSNHWGFGPRVLPDGSVFFNAYGCAFYRLTNIDSDEPRLDNVLTLRTPSLGEDERVPGSCGIPIVFGRYWLMPVGKLHAVVVLDIADPAHPREVSRLTTRDTFNPHWLARDPLSNRLALGAELGGEEGYFILRFDETVGRLTFDAAIKVNDEPGYLSLDPETWPHGRSGTAWAHAALFVP